MVVSTVLSNVSKGILPFLKEKVLSDGDKLVESPGKVEGDCIELNQGKLKEELSLEGTEGVEKVEERGDIA